MFAEFKFFFSSLFDQTHFYFLTIIRYVGSDETGTPLVIFNVHGVVIKSTERTPFGRLIRDTDPSIYVAVDFRGGIITPHTGFIHYGSRVYDPSIIQWLTPEWEHLVTHLNKPQDVFIYRFRNNDPISIDNQQRYMTSELVNCSYEFCVKTNAEFNFLKIYF